MNKLIAIVTIAALGFLGWITMSHSNTPPTTVATVCENASEADVLTALGEGMALRDTSLQAFLRQLSELNGGQPNPAMSHIRLYQHPSQPVTFVIAFNEGCVVGKIMIPNAIMQQLLPRANN